MLTIHKVFPYRSQSILSWQVICRCSVAAWVYYAKCTLLDKVAKFVKSCTKFLTNLHLHKK